MNANSGPLTKEAMELCPAIDSALPASGENTNLIIRLSDFMDKVEKLELAKAAVDSQIETSVALGTKTAETEVKLGARIVELLTALERCRFYAEDRNSDAVILIVKTVLNTAPLPDWAKTPRFSAGLSPLETNL